MYNATYILWDYRSICSIDSCICNCRTPWSLSLSWMIALLLRSTTKYIHAPLASPLSIYSHLEKQLISPPQTIPLHQITHSNQYNKYRTTNNLEPMPIHPYTDRPGNFNHKLQIHTCIRNTTDSKAKKSRPTTTNSSEAIWQWEVPSNAGAKGARQMARDSCQATTHDVHRQHPYPVRPNPHLRSTHRRENLVH